MVGYIGLEPIHSGVLSALPLPLGYYPIPSHLRPAGPRAASLRGFEILESKPTIKTPLLWLKDNRRPHPAHATEPR